MTDKPSENRDRFPRLNPARTEKAVKSIQTLVQTGKRSSYEYTHQEARDCFSAIESAAQELWGAFGLPPATPASPGGGREAGGR